MAMSMPPPMVPGFSLRVQLYSPNAHDLNDKPLRCFRVVISPEASVREFCEEASRIHQINYGEPIVIKKCQDDQEFDITQSEILGTIFASAATIRIIQASATPNVRDSVPPTSALRFDPTNQLSRKREREESPRTNGSTSYQPNKRQRVSDLDPDKPLPSRETDSHSRRTIYEEEEPGEEVVPNSQKETSYTGSNGNLRHVRDDVPRISETPTPPPEVPDLAHFESSSADRQNPKSHTSSASHPLMSQADIPSPFGPASRAKSASYHIQRATERGTSVSTAATSPLSGDQQAPPTNGSRSSNKRKVSDLVPGSPAINGKPFSRSDNEDSIYDNVLSDSEGSAILRRTKDKLKGNSNSPSGLPGLSWVADKFNTPPNGSRRNSRSQERIMSNGALALTSISKEREERQRQKEQAEEARKVRAAAAEAAEKRQREADEARAAKDQERIRKDREKSEHEAQKKRNAVVSKAARLEKERLEQVERDRKDGEDREAEENLQEERGIRERTKQAERLEREKKLQLARERLEAEALERERQSNIEKEQRETEGVKREKLKAAEAERVYEEEAKRRAKETALAMERMRKSREQSEQSKASTPDRTKATLIRPQSSTAFIPSGRKSALKAPSSQAAVSSSPALARPFSAGSPNSSKNELEASNEVKRRVSFDLKDVSKQTPVRPPILPPSRASASRPSPAPKTPTPIPSVAAKETTPKPPIVIKKEPSRKASPITPASVKQSTTRILPPTARRSTTPHIQSAIVPPHAGASKATPPIAKSVSPIAQSVSQSRGTPEGSKRANDSTKSASPPAVQVTISSDEDSGEEEVDDDDEEDDEDNLDASNRMEPDPANANGERRPTSQDQDDDEEDENEDGDVEMQDMQSSRSASRSPVVFHSHSTPRNVQPTKTVELASSTSDDSDDEDESGDDVVSADGEEEASEEEGEDDDKTITALAPRSSPPSLPATKRTVNGRNPSQPSSAAVKNTPVLASSSSNTSRPKSTYATLSQLKNTIVGSSASKANGKAQPLKLARNEEDSEEESEEESDSDSSSEEEDELEPSQPLPKPKQAKSTTTDSDDSGSDSESRSDMETEDDEEMARNELAAQISKMQSDSQMSTQSHEIPNPKVTKGPQDSKSSGSAKGKEVNAGSTKNKYLTGYAFSQPR